MVDDSLVTTVVAVGPDTAGTEAGRWELDQLAKAGNESK